MRQTVVAAKSKKGAGYVYYKPAIPAWKTTGDMLPDTNVFRHSWQMRFRGSPSAMGRVLVPREEHLGKLDWTQRSFLLQPPYDRTSCAAPVL